MAIAVHCPNPGCARVHQVKDKYAGTRGKCPLCSSWMYVPAVPAVAPPRADAPTPVPALDETPAPTSRQKQAAPVPLAAPVKKAAELPATDPHVALDEPPPPASEEIPAHLRRRRRAPVVEDEEEAVAEIAVEEEPAAKSKSKRHFSWLGVLVLVLGTLGLGAFALAPFLPPPSFQKSGAFANLPSPRGIGDDVVLLISGAGGAVAVLGVMCLLVCVVFRRFDPTTLLLLYLALLGSSVLLFAGLEWLKVASKDMTRTTEEIQKLKDKGEEGEAVPSLGMQHYAMAGGAAAACGFFVLTALFMHKRLWSKLLGFAFLSFWPVLVAVWVFHATLGIDKASLPFDLPFTLPPL